MENTLENKAKYFAQHLKQKVIMKPDWEEFNDRSPMALDPTYLVTGNHVLTAGYLLLKPLSSITDEDASELWDLLHPRGGNKKDLTKQEIINQAKSIAESLNYVNGGWMVGLLAVVNCYQFLQLKGYALPWMGLSVEKLIEYCWLKLKID